MKEKKSKKYIRAAAVILGIAFIASLIPLLGAAFYAHPVNDDYSFSWMTRRALQGGEGLWGLLSSAGEETALIYNTWQGTFSAIFLFSLQPGIWGQEYYVITTFVLTGLLTLSTFLFLDAIFGKLLSFSRAGVAALAFLVLILDIQFVPDIPEGYFWYNGSIYYTGFYSLALILAAVIIQNAIRPGAGLTILSILLGAVIGGGNYTTVLLVLVCLFLFFVWTLVSAAGVRREEKAAEHTDRCTGYGSTDEGWNRKEKKVWRQRILAAALPFIAVLLCFVISAMAPGNSARAAELSSGMRPQSAIAASVFFAAVKSLQWGRLPELSLAGILAPFIYRSSAKMLDAGRREDKDERTGGLWKVICRQSGNPAILLILLILEFLVFAASFTPSLYAMSNIGAGRQQDIYYYAFILLILVMEVTVCTQLAAGRISKERRKEEKALEEGESKEEKGTKKVPAQSEKVEKAENSADTMPPQKSRHSRPCAGLLWAVFMAVLFLTGTKLYGIHSLTSVKAFTALRDGSLAQYDEAYDAMTQEIQNQGEDVVIDVLLDTPEIFERLDLEESPEGWVNSAMARYYEKNSIRVELQK